jgi:hypothetical protein
MSRDLVHMSSLVNCGVVLNVVKHLTLSSLPAGNVEQIANKIGSGSTIQQTHPPPRMKTPVIRNAGQNGETTMTDELFTSIFPNGDMVPEKYRIASPIEQRQYLCDRANK